ncbi:MAG: hypothetical protein K2F63_00540 [Muribaculaceae bacterium]|nr:hypothetical protein [Muribaculaceae bacterium]MDE6134603.1 hypothetical protein [Muribaculaceae bacterium]
MLKTIKNFLAVVMVGLALASCNNNSEPGEYIVKLPLNNFITMSDDLTDGTKSYGTEVGYEIRFNFTTMKAIVMINKLTLPDGMVYPSLTLADIPIKIEKDGAIKLDGENITPSGNGLLSVPYFDKVEFYFYERLFEDLYYPAATFEFVINGKYRMISTYAKQMLYGKLVSESEEGNKFKTSDPYYFFDINPATRTANITLHQVRFVQQMSRPLDIDLKNVPFLMDGEKLKFDLESIVPTIGDSPYPDYVLTNVKGEMDLTEGFSMEFTCNPPKLGRFVVEIEAEYSDTNAD